MLAKGLPLTALAIYQGADMIGVYSLTVDYRGSPDLVWLIGGCSGGSLAILNP